MGECPKLPTSASVLAELESQVETLGFEDCLVLLSDLERLKSRMWVRLMTLKLVTVEQARGQLTHLLTIPQVAKIIGIPGGRVYELARQGRLPVVRVGKYVRVEPAKLEEFIEQHRK